MPRTQKYDVNESIASSQATIISRVNDNSIGAHGNHVGESAPPKKSFISFGWCTAVVFGALCLTFILCVAFIKIPGIPTERVRPTSSRRILQKQGYFQIYPAPSDERSSSSPRIQQVIYLSDMNSSIQQLKKVLSDYPDHINPYTPCFVSIPKFNSPCFFEKEWLGKSCTEENSFGYKEIDGMINPCILLRLENLTDWQPSVYRLIDVDESWLNVYTPTSSSIGCIIPDKRDKQQHSIDINPLKGFPNQFFPVTGFNRTLYLQPSIMLQIKNLLVGESVTIQCSLRVSNAYLLKDDGEIIINITSVNSIRNNLPSTSSNLPSSSSTMQEVDSSTIISSTTEVLTQQTITVKQLSSTVPGLRLKSDN